MTEKQKFNAIVDIINGLDTELRVLFNNRFCESDCWHENDYIFDYDNEMDIAEISECISLKGFTEAILRGNYDGSRYFTLYETWENAMPIRTYQSVHPENGEALTSAETISEWILFHEDPLGDKDIYDILHDPLTIEVTSPEYSALCKEITEAQEKLEKLQKRLEKITER